MHVDILMSKGHFIVAWCLFALTKVAHLTEVPFVKSPHGQIRGIVQTTYGGKQVHAYLGIPFGQPPIGEGRFLRPKPFPPWKGVLNATANPPICHQHEYPFAAVIPFLMKWHITVNMSEDCLYLNVWVPISKPQKATVMVWLYGGAFSKGGVSFPLYNGGSLAAEEDVIVVSLNYRVSVFGFLYLDDQEIPGNAGMYDQLLALQWIRDNIEAFGGDQHSITVFGESSGAVSTGLLLISPKNDIFKRAIMQSGSPDVPWATIDKMEASRRAMGVAQYVGCDHGNKTTIAKCLRNQNVANLLEAEPEDPRGTGVAPVVDGELVLPNGTASGKWSDFEILLGTNANEGTLFFLNFFLNSFDLFSDTLTIKRPVFLKFLKEQSPYRDVPEAIDMVAYLYTDWMHPNYTNDAIDNIISDLQFTCDIHKTAAAVDGSGGRAFMYRYANRASYSLFPRWLGVFHSHEMEILFGEPLVVHSKYSAEDRALSQLMGQFWANFARTGDPNKSPEGQSPPSVTWPEYTVANKEYLTLAANRSYPGQGLRYNYCVFWDSFLPNMVSQLRNVSVGHKIEDCKNNNLTKDAKEEVVSR